MASKHGWKIPVISVDSEGNSFFDEMFIPLEEPTNGNSIGTLSELIPVTGIYFRETPADYDFDFHVAPRKQFIISLDSSVEIEVTNGEKKLFNQGSVIFLEDVKGKGHKSRSVENKVRKSVFLGVPDDFQWRK